jgi:hypothetical protein
LSRAEVTGSRIRICKLLRSREPVFVNVDGALELIKRNRFRQPGGPVQQIGLSYRPTRIKKSLDFCNIVTAVIVPTVFNKQNWVEKICCFRKPPKKRMGSGWYGSVDLYPYKKKCSGSVRLVLRQNVASHNVYVS